MKSRNIKWRDLIGKDDLPNDDIKNIADICGMDTAIKIMENMPGLLVNIPKNGMRKVKNRYIAEHYNGHNVKELAVICNMSMRHVYNVIKDLQSL